MTFKLKLYCLFCAIVFSTSAPSAFADPQDTIDHRVHIMRTIREQSEILSLIDQKKAPADHVAVHAQVLALNVASAKAAFQPNVPGGRAKPEVWSQWAEFSKKLDALNAAASDLVKSTKSGGTASLGSKLAALDCKGCHESYRGPKK